MQLARAIIRCAKAPDIITGLYPDRRITHPGTGQKQKRENTPGLHWVYHSPLEKMVLFDYRDGRLREGSSLLLKNFKGYLQSDAYVVHNSFEKGSITLLNCMAHARRGFEKLLSHDKEKAEHALKTFQNIYAVERKSREADMSPEERYSLRLDESLPELNKLSKWMVEMWRHTKLSCQNNPSKQQ